MTKPVITTTQPDGLYLSAQATLSQLGEDETLRLFADGLVIKTLNVKRSNVLTLSQALHHSGPEIYPLLTALLALDAEVQVVVDEERRALPLPGFLSYRASLPPDKAPLTAVRLPPLNRGGRYHFAVTPDGLYLATRLDLHPTLGVVGHVRLALSSLTRPPTRLLPIEQRLDRQFVNPALIESTIAAGSREISPVLTPAEQAGLAAAIQPHIKIFASSFG
jgi:xanthine dehydrogenase iron-sulfur cluster and FAD-binding subunit A